MAESPYDEIADWYEGEFLAKQRMNAGAELDFDLLGIDRSLTELLGEGSDTCLEIGCGTGVYAERVRQLGWTPVGIDISVGMLHHAQGRLPVAQANAEALPVQDGSLSAVISVMVHTDVANYPKVLGEVVRVLRPGGVFVHVGVHPCFCGGFADRSDPEAVVIRPGYLEHHWTKASWTANGLRDKVGATHSPMPEMLNAFIDAGLVLERFGEGGEPTPIAFSVKARKLG